MINAINIEKIISDGGNETSILKNINFSINSGEFICLFGPMGSGKSSLIKILGLLNSPSSGELIVLDQNVTEMSEKSQNDFRKGNIGYVFNDSYLVESMTVAENVALPLRYLNYNKRERHAKVEEQLKNLNLYYKINTYPRELTHIQKQKVSLARALVIKPKLLLVDEPTGKMNSSQGDEFLESLNQQQYEGLTIVLGTQSSVVSKVASRIINIFDGHLNVIPNTK